MIDFKPHFSSGASAFWNGTPGSSLGFLSNSILTGYFFTLAEVPLSRMPITLSSGLILM
jgi:hypothetical protein